MYLVLGVGGLTLLGLSSSGCSSSLFAWIALAFVSALCGFVSLLAGGGGRLDPPGTPLPHLTGPDRAADAELQRAARPGHGGAAGHSQRPRSPRAGCAAFDLFILSDTTDPDIWIAEEAAFLALRDRTGSAPCAHLLPPPRRRTPSARPATSPIGCGGSAAPMPQFLILDADSVMTGDTIVRLAAAMERNPDVGLIQTLPVIVNGATLFARMQQFAGRVYGPLIAHGIAWWHGAEGNYWGHNAMIRTGPSPRHAGLPKLPGRKPFGGHIMSHDFVEAALMRRAGWAMHMVPALPGSYEESPPSLAGHRRARPALVPGQPAAHAAILPRAACTGSAGCTC